MRKVIVNLLLIPVVLMICDEMTKLMVYVTMRDKSEMQRAGKCDTTK